MIGQTVSHYKILEKLGEGGMGVVYKAEDTKLRRSVALKFLPPELTRDHEAKERFIHEARAASALDHPNICSIHEIDETKDGRIFISMAYYEGETIKKKIERGPLKLEETIDTAMHIARGLAKAHERGIVHRDIKPANILMTEDGQVKILDFGLAKLTGQTRLTKTGRTIGTVAFMSPEQLRGGEIDQRSDIWSFGVTLYEMLTGQLPFKGDYEQAVMYSIVNESPAPVTGLRTGVPMELERLIVKCLQKDPELRYQHIEDLLSDIKLLKSIGIQPIKGIRTERSIKKIWAERKLQYIITFAAVVVLAVSIFLLTRKRVSAPVSPTYKQLTFSGTAYSPSVSPDGNFLAWAEWTHPLRPKLMLRDLASDRTISLLQTHGIWSCRWSPDGSEILVAASFDSTAVDEGRIPRWAVYRIARLGGPPRIVQAGRTQLPAWSPDGSQWAWLGRREDALWIDYVDIASGDTTGSISLAEPETESTIPAARMSGHTLRWSPTGTILAFVSGVRGEMKNGILIVPRDKVEPYKVLEDSVRILDFCFSPRGDAIYYLRSEEEIASLMKLPISSKSGRPRKQPYRIIHGLSTYVSSALSIGENPRRLFVCQTLHYSNLWEVTPDTGSDGKRQITAGAKNVEHPAVSPDGKWLAYTKGDSWNVSNIFIMPASGGPERQLTFTSTLNEPLVWSHDGTAIIFIREGKIWSVPIDGGRARMLFEIEGDQILDLAYSPTPDIVYWAGTSGISRYYRMDPNGRAKQPLFPETVEGNIQNIVYSPDHKKIAVSVRKGRSTELSIFNREDSTLTPLLSTFSVPFAWSQDGLWIYHSGRNTDGEFIVRKTRIDGTESEAIVKLGMDQAWWVTKIPGEDRFVACIVEYKPDIWMIDDFDPDAN